jgi:hypothetical protein
MEFGFSLVVKMKESSFFFRSCHKNNTVVYAIYTVIDRICFSFLFICSVWISDVKKNVQRRDFRASMFCDIGRIWFSGVSLSHFLTHHLHV